MVGGQRTLTKSSSSPDTAGHSPPPPEIIGQEGAQQGRHGHPHWAPTAPLGAVHFV